MGRRLGDSARPKLMARQHGADGFDQLRFRHGALRLGLLLQMFLAALFQLGELGAMIRSFIALPLAFVGP